MSGKAKFIKQAKAAERQFAILQAQIEGRAGIALATLKANIAELRETASDWFRQMNTWGQLGPQAPIGIRRSREAVSSKLKEFS